MARGAITCSIAACVACAEESAKASPQPAMPVSVSTRTSSASMLRRGHAAGPGHACPDIQRQVDQHRFDACDFHAFSFWGHSKAGILPRNRNCNAVTVATTTKLICRKRRPNPSECRSGTAPRMVLALVMANGSVAMTDRRWQ